MDALGSSVRRGDQCERRNGLVTRRSLDVAHVVDPSGSRIPRRPTTSFAVKDDDLEGVRRTIAFGKLSQCCSSEHLPRELARGRTALVRVIAYPKLLRVGLRGRLTAQKQEQYSGRRSQGPSHGRRDYTEMWRSEEKTQRGSLRDPFSTSRRSFSSGGHIPAMVPPMRVLFGLVALLVVGCSSDRIWATGAGRHGGECSRGRRGWCTESASPPRRPARRRAARRPRRRSRESERPELHVRASTIS